MHSGTPSHAQGILSCAQGPLHLLRGPFICSGALSFAQGPFMHSGAPSCAQGSVAHFSPALEKSERGDPKNKMGEIWAKKIRGRWGGAPHT